MDPIIDELCNWFGMINFWDHRHVNQAIVRQFKEYPGLSLVLEEIADIRNSDSVEEAKLKIDELKMILTKEKMDIDGSEISNPLQNSTLWSYLEKHILKDLNKICRWTVKHLTTDFWKWTQAIESRHNKDLNIWNQKSNQLSVVECIMRYNEIDKAELRQIYLHYVDSKFTNVINSITASRKNIEKKMITTLVREYWQFEGLSTVLLQSDNNCQQTTENDNVHMFDINTTDSKEDSIINMTIGDRIKQLQEIAIIQSKKSKKQSIVIDDEQPKGEAETKFGKPSKRQKRPRVNFCVSDEDVQLKSLILGEPVDIEHLPLQKNAKGTLTLAVYYQWSKKFFKSIKKNQLRLWAQEYNFSFSGTREQLIQRLIEKRSLLMQNPPLSSEIGNKSKPSKKK